MPFFRSKRDEAAPPAEAWTPTVDLAGARSALLEAIHVTNSNGRVSRDQMETIIKRLLVLGGAPRDELDFLSGAPFEERSRRPWVWLAANTRNAHANGDHEFVAYSSFWVHMWKNMMYPKFGKYEHRTYFTSDVPPEVVAEIAGLAQNSLALLPRDQLLFGDETGEITAGWWNDHLGQALS